LFISHTHFWSSHITLIVQLAIMCRCNRELNVFGLHFWYSCLVDFQLQLTFTMESLFMCEEMIHLKNVSNFPTNS